MMTFTELACAPPDALGPFTDRLRLAVAAYLARFKGSSREHTESDLRCYLAWCAGQGLDPLAAQRPHLELVHPVDARDPPVQALHRVPPVLRHSRVLPDLRHRRNHRPLARRARAPPRGARRITHAGVHHLQFEALLTTARESPNRCDFARVAMLGLLGLRIFEATGADIADLGEEHGHRVLRVCGKGTKIVLVPLPPAVGRAIDRAIGNRTRGPVLLNSRGARMDRHAATRRLRHLAGTAGIQVARAHPHMLRHSGHDQFRRWRRLRDVQIAARHADPRTTMRYDRARQNLDRHPNYILAAYMASGT
jgi:integrase/recombinase XerD